MKSNANSKIKKKPNAKQILHRQTPAIEKYQKTEIETERMST